MKKLALAATMVLPVVLAGCVYSHERDVARTAAPAVVAAPSRTVVVPEARTTTTITQAPVYTAPAPIYTAPGTVTTTTRRDTVIENRY